MNVKPSRNDPTNNGRCPRWFQEPPPPDPRPVGHPRWGAFCRWVKSGRDRVNPRLVDSPSQYGLHGEQLWCAFLAGTEDGPEYAI